ncbi:DNA replication protein [Escherichia coli]|uniref:DNA replication protein n=1 Tax=Escherichia coli TaxID=562 RepID=UPI0010CB3E92|nr:DNA replication protein [Escherichia coli]GDQ66480.1 replication protein [Escherichia coli]
MGVVKLADYRHNPVQHQEASSMGYVSIHRQFMDSRLYKDSQAVHLWLHLILKANHESTVVNTDIGPITVDRGQMITGRPSLVRETFIPDNKVRSLLRTFESKGMLNICSMGKKFSLFTIVKYDDFQAKNCPTVVQRLSNANTSNGEALSGDCPTVVQRLSNANTSNGEALSGDCPTVVQRLSINNNINNISNTDVLESATADKKSDKKKPSVSCQDVVDAYHEILPEAPRIRALNDKRKNQIRTFWRKAGVITRQLDGHGFSMQDWRNYLSYVGENCRWMFEERPNHQRGTVWHKKGFDFLLNDNTYLKVREGEHDDR